MKTIFKYALKTDIKNVQEIEIPVKAKILKVELIELLSKEAVLFAYVDTENEKEIRQFEVFTTGQNMPDLYRMMRIYIGTFILVNGKVSMHVFELKESFKMKQLNGVEQ